MRSRIPTEAITSAIVSKPVRLVLPAALLALLSFFPSRAQDMSKASLSQTSIDVQCVDNLKRIHKLITLYLHQAGGALGFPSNLERIYLMAKEPKPFVCPGDKQINAPVKKHTFRTSYEVVSDPLKPGSSATPPDSVAIVAEQRPNHNGKRFVLFYDGSVRAFDEAQFDKLRNNSFIDIRTLDKNR